jgi:hypothetical protein
MNRTIALVPLALLMVTVACAPPRGGEEPPGAEAVDGVWTAEFAIESPLLPGHMPREETISGELALLRNSSLARTAALSGPPTHSGSYAARFRPFGFEIDGGREIPTLVARFFATDSLEITLQPDGEDAVWMKGVLAGDSIAGHWSYAPFRGGSASGRFIMRRSGGASLLQN